jgi:hypothetical protein
MTNFRKFRPGRRLVVLAAQTGAASWLWQNRRQLGTRLRRAASDVLTSVKQFVPASVSDRGRPLGERFVHPFADRAPTRCEEARADEAPSVTPAVADHMKEAASHVLIRPTN